jgi:ketopantoate hydroxymethyltransferase
MKQRGEKISMLTAYDYTMGTIVDRAGVDIILVGDSASNVMCGNVTTLPITLDQMIFMAKSVVRGVKRALVVVDMPEKTPKPIYIHNGVNFGVMVCSEQQNSKARIRFQGAVDTLMVQIFSYYSKT